MIVVAICRRFAADLVQLNNGVRVAPKGWKCENCDKRDNLWLNLSDGTILCGRKVPYLRLGKYCKHLCFSFGMVPAGTITLWSITKGQIFHFVLNLER